MTDTSLTDTSPADTNAASEAGLLPGGAGISNGSGDPLGPEASARVSTRARRFLALLRARNLEFVRDRSSFMWNLLLPILLVVGFSFAFSGSGQASFTVGFYGGDPAQTEIASAPGVETVVYDDLAEATERIRHHQIDFLVNLEAGSYLVATDSTNAQIVETLFLAQVDGSYVRQEITGQPIRYVDWLAPGIIGMNIMFSGLFGVGFVVVRYRRNGVLKRMKATPTSPLEFVAAQATSRFIIVFLVSLFVFGAIALLLDILILGNPLYMMILAALGILSMISLGLVFASRMKNEELANGLMNLVTWPMMLFSGVFFSLEAAPELLQRFSRLFPLTHMLEGIRAVMLDGAGLADIWVNIVALGAFTLVFTAIASATFRWE